MKNVLVNGCSFSRGPGSWPYYLQSKFNFNLVNLAQAAAGNLYIYNSTIAELTKRKYDTVLIMWSGLERIDCQVEDITVFDKTPYTSYTQSKLNDWPEKIIYPVNDQDYVEKNWVFACNNKDKFLQNIKFCDTQFRYMGLEQHVSQSIIHMLSLQVYLEHHNINYVFMFYQDYLKTIRRNNLFPSLNLKKFYITENINTIAVKNNWLASDKCHPSEVAHEVWSNLLSNWLIENEY